MNVRTRKPTILGISLWLLCESAVAGPIGTNLALAPGVFPDVAYSTTSHKYLVVYSNGQIRGKRLTQTGQVSGSEINISEPVAGGGIYPDVAYNATNDEFLAVWDDQRQAPYATWGQRVKASDGTLLGTNFAIGDTGSFAASVAWSPIGNQYLVVWRAGGTTRGRWVSGGGGPQGSAFQISATQCFYPHVAFGATSFLITWDDNAGPIVGSCLTPGSTTAGSLIPVSGTTHGGRTATAFDPGGGANVARWLVQYSHIGFYSDFDQYGSFVSSQCVAEQISFPIAGEQAHEGDTNFGAAVAFIPDPPRYMSIFQTSGGAIGDGTAVQEFSRYGQLRGGQDLLATVVPNGNTLGQAVAGDPQAGRFLNTWCDLGTGWVYTRLYEPIKPVTQFQGLAGDREIHLSWTNSPTGDSASTVIRYKMTGYPTSPNDGLLLVEQPGAAGSSGSFTHTRLKPGVTVYYAAFAKDSGERKSDAATASAVPTMSADFDDDQDVDQADFGHLQACLTDASEEAPAECLDADFDVDGDVDAEDAATFMNCYAGPNHAPGC